MRAVRLSDLGIPGLGGWGDDPAWGRVYDWTVEHRRVGGLLWRLGIGSDLDRLYAAAAEIGRQDAGSTVLDIPCGGGVALRGLKPGQDLRYVAADISQRMLDRTAAAARKRGVADQVQTRLADVEDLPFGDEEFDLVISLTGLHCFPDPHRALTEMVRVLHSGGVITGSTVLTDTGLRYEHVRRVGRLAGLLGPMCSSADLRTWLTTLGCTEVSLDVSGALGYFRAVRR